MLIVGVIDGPNEFVDTIHFSHNIVISKDRIRMSLIHSTFSEKSSSKTVFTMSSFAFILQCTKELSDSQMCGQQA